MTKGKYNRLLKVGSLAGSLGVYLPTVFCQKGLGLARVAIFTWLLARTQYGLWGLATMIFNLAASVVTLGSTEGLVRYVSSFEAAGRLEFFYRRVRWIVLGLGAGLTGAALLAAGPLAKSVFYSHQEAVSTPWATQVLLCRLALVNGLGLALYHAMLSFLVGLRNYRLVAVIELAFGVLFTAAGVVSLMVWRSSSALLTAHLGALAAAMVMGVPLLHAAIASRGGDRGPQEDTDFSPLAGPEPSVAETMRKVGPGPDVVLEPSVDDDGTPGVLPVPHRRPTAQAATAPGLGRVVRFGAVSFLAGLLWQLAAYVSLQLTSRWLGKAQAGVYYVFWMLCQSVQAVANAAWGVVFAHVAKRWESDDRAHALAMLELAYKTVAMVVLSATLVAYASAPLWQHLLAREYQEGIVLLPGLLLLFQMTSQLALLTILAKLHERPAVIGLTAILAGAINLALAIRLVPAYDVVGAATAAGLGMFLGGMLAAVLYFALAHVRLHAATYAIVGAPILLLLPAWAACLVWAGLLLLAWRTRLIFTHRERRVLWAALGRMAARLGLGGRRV